MRLLLMPAFSTWAFLVALLTASQSTRASAGPGDSAGAMATPVPESTLLTMAFMLRRVRNTFTAAVPRVLVGARRADAGRLSLTVPPPGLPPPGRSPSTPALLPPPPPPSPLLTPGPAPAPAPAPNPAPAPAPAPGASTARGRLPAPGLTLAAPPPPAALPPPSLPPPPPGATRGPGPPLLPPSTPLPTTE